MFDESFPDRELKRYCEVRTSYKCKGSQGPWADASGIGDNCDDAQANMFEAYTFLCTRAEEGVPVFATIDWRCSCERP